MMKDIITNVFAAIGFVVVAILCLNYFNEREIDSNMHYYYDSRGLVATGSRDLFGKEAWATVYDSKISGVEDIDNSHNLVCAIKDNRICRKCGKYIEGAYVLYESIYSADNKLIDGGYECEECYHTHN